MINASEKEIIFTSGATESNNLAIKGIAYFPRRKNKKHIITVETEHKCVLDSCRSLEMDGFKVTYLPVKKDGIIDLDVLKSSITDDTLLVSVMFVNNEIGVIQPIKQIGEICRERGVYFHTDVCCMFCDLFLIFTHCITVLLYYALCIVHCALCIVHCALQ